MSILKLFDKIDSNYSYTLESGIKKINQQFILTKKSNEDIILIESTNNTLKLSYLNSSIEVYINNELKKTITLDSITNFIQLYTKSSTDSGAFDIEVNNDLYEISNSVLGGEDISKISIYNTNGYMEYYSSSTDYKYEQVISSNIKILSNSWDYNNTFSTTLSNNSFTVGAEAFKYIDTTTINIVAIQLGISNISTMNASNKIKASLSLSGTSVDLGAKTLGDNTNLSFYEFNTVNPITNKKWTYNDLLNLKYTISTSDNNIGTVKLNPTIRIVYYSLNQISAIDIDSTVSVSLENIYSEKPILFGTYIPTNDKIIDIPSALTVDKAGTISKDLDCTLNIIGGLYKDIDSSLIAPLYLDIPSSITPELYLNKDIPASLTPWLSEIKDISSSITVSPDKNNDVDIDCSITVTGMITEDISCSLNYETPIDPADIYCSMIVAKVFTSDIDCTLTFNAGIEKDIDASLIFEKAITPVDINGKIIYANDYTLDLFSELEVEVAITKYIDCTFILTRADKSYVYLL